MDGSRSLNDLLNARRSCRDFDSAPLIQREFRLLCALQNTRPDRGHATPSAHDLRPLALLAAIGSAPWTHPQLARVGDGGTLTEVRDGDIRHELEAGVFDDQPWIAAAPVVFAITADVGRLDRTFAEQDAFRGRDFAMIEAGALAQSMLLRAVDLGLGAVLVAGIRQGPLQRALRTDRHVIALVPVGHPTN